MGCAAADGSAVPPMVIFKGVRINKYLVDAALEGYMIKFSKSGWINSILFEDWLESHFIPYVNKYVRQDDVSQRVILFLDGHKSHKSLYAIETALKQNIEIICLPPQMTHVLQPLDISFFKSLKSIWFKLNEEFCRKNHHSFVTKGTFTKVFEEAWNQAVAKPRVIKNGFERIGLCPFQRLTLKDILKDKALSPANCLNRPVPSPKSSMSELGDINDQSPTGDAAEFEDEIGTVNLPMNEVGEANNQDMSDLSTPADTAAQSEAGDVPQPEPDSNEMETASNVDQLLQMIAQEMQMKAQRLNHCQWTAIINL